MHTEPATKWRSKRQVADHFGNSPRSIERWVAKGKFPAGTQFPNGHWYWPIEVVEAYERKLMERQAAE